MQFVQNPQLNQELLNRLRVKYLGVEKPHPHLTEILYCLTRTYNDLLNPEQSRPTDKELLLFAVGFGLESVLLYDKDSPPPQSVTMDGISLTMDYIDMQGVGLDLKSTRARSKPDGTPQYGWSETWLEQFMAYARAQWVTSGKELPEQVPYGVAVVYIIPPDSVVGTFLFTREEVETNWANIVHRRDVLTEAFATLTPPEPFKWNKKWECGVGDGCRWLARCEEQTGQKAPR